METQNNAEKLEQILETLKREEKEKWEYCKSIAKAFGEGSAEYQTNVARWVQWYDAYQLVANIVNSK